MPVGRNRSIQDEPQSGGVMRLHWVTWIILAVVLVRVLSDVASLVAYSEILQQRQSALGPAHDLPVMNVGVYVSEFAQALAYVASAAVVEILFRIQRGLRRGAAVRGV